MHWSNLITFLKSGVSKPEGFLENELLESLMNGTKLECPNLPSHSQSLERAIKLTTEASHSVYGFEARHGHILAKVLCHKTRPFFAFKGYYLEQFDMLIISQIWSNVPNRY